MIYRNNNYGNINKADKVQSDSEYFLARKDIIISRVNGTPVTLEKDTLFSMETEHFMSLAEYEINIKSYEISALVKECIGRPYDYSPLAVKDAVFLKVTEREYDRMMNEFDVSTLRMSKQVLEDSLMRESRIVQHCTSMVPLMQEHLKTEQEAELIKQMLESDFFSLSERDLKSFFNSIINVFEMLEEKPVVSVLIQMFSGAVSIGIICRLLIDMGTSTTVGSYIVFTVSIIAAIVSVLVALMKLSGAAEFLRDLLSLPLIAGRMLFVSGTRRMDSLNQEYENIRQVLYSNEVKQRELRKQLMNDFPEMLRTIMSGNMLPGDTDMKSLVYTGLNFSGLNAADIPETETRTDEEIRGGYERVVYPVYADGHTGRPEHDKSMKRRVISLSKTGKTASEVPERKKVDLTKH